MPVWQLQRLLLKITRFLHKWNWLKAAFDQNASWLKAGQKLQFFKIKGGMALACHVIAVTVLQIWSLNALSLGVIEWALGPALIKPSLALNPLSFRIFAFKNTKKL